jgi:hypothetical protein
MKKHFNVFLLCMLMIGIYACSDSKTTPDAKDVAASKHASTVSRLPTEISDTVAIARKAAWSAKRAQLINLLKANNMAGDSIYIVRGYAVPTQDFKDISLIASTDPRYPTTTYTMIGLKDSLDIIFQIIDATGKERYFDFSNPCPKNCPPDR